MELENSKRKLKILSLKIHIDVNARARSRYISKSLWAIKTRYMLCQSEKMWLHFKTIIITLKFALEFISIEWPLSLETENKKNKKMQCAMRSSSARLHYFLKILEGFLFERNKISVRFVYTTETFSRFHILCCARNLLLNLHCEIDNCSHTIIDLNRYFNSILVRWCNR